MVHFNLEKLENLPSKETPFNKWKRGYRNYDGYDSTFGKRNPYFTARKIAEKNVGKSFNDAFSYYCKNVKKEDQKEFLEMFDTWWRYPKYLIDENGLIQRHPDRLDKFRETKRIFKSSDIEYQIVHKDSGIPKENFEPVEIIVGYKEVLEWNYEYNKHHKYKRRQKFVTKPIKKLIGYELIHKKNKYACEPLPYNKRIFVKESDFITVVTKGFELKFDSPKDPHLVRLRNENAKRSKREYIKKYKTDTTNYDFILRQGEQRLIKENSDKLLTKKQMAAKLKAENDIVILAHGFDLETSFRTPISWKKKKEKDLVDSF